MRKTAFLPGLRVRSRFLAPRIRKRGQAVSPCNRRFSKGGALEYTMPFFAVKVGSPELLEYDGPQISLFLKSSMREARLSG
jgi:hypothetical protein